MLPKISLIVAFVMMVAAAPLADASVRVDSRKRSPTPSRSASIVLAQQIDNGGQDQPESSNPQVNLQDDLNGNAEQGQAGEDQDSQGAGAPEQAVPNEVRVPGDGSHDSAPTMTPYQQPVNPYQ